MNRATQTEGNEMKATSFKGTVESAYGKVLPTAVSFSGEFEAVETVEEIPDGEKLGPADIIDVVNAKRKAAARAKATTEALQAAGIEKPDPNSEEVMLEQSIKMNMKLYSLDRATAEKVVAAARQAALALK
jgi:hypothetical protein